MSAKQHYVKTNNRWNTLHQCASTRCFVKDV
jgi:hypothetical protein